MKKLLSLIPIMLFLFTIYPESSQASFDSAETIQPDDTVQGSFGDQWDRKYYQLTTTSNGNLKISMGNNTYSGWEAILYDSAGNELNRLYTEDGSYALGKTEIETGISKGTYYIEVVHNSGNYNTKFDLSVDFTASEFYEKEVNDSLEKANAVALNKTYKGNIQYSYYDPDFYKFTLVNDGNVTVSLPRKTNSSWEVTILNEFGEEYEYFHTSYSSTALGNELRSVGLPKGTYYLKIDDYSSSESVPYEFTVGFVKSDYYEKEFNDSFEAADSIKLNQYYNGVIQSYYDEDFYKMTLPSSMSVNILFKKMYQKSWDVTVLDSYGNEVDYFYTDYNQSASGYQKEGLTLKAGTYYIQVGSGSAEDAPYQFMIEARTAAPSVGNVKIENYKGKSDKITVNKLSKGDVVKIYNAASGGKIIATSPAVTSTSAAVYVKQLSEKAGTVYVTVTRPGYKESSRTKVSYKGEPSNGLKATSVKTTNNNNKADVVTVSGLAKGDIVKVYNSASKLLATSSQAKSSSVSLSISELGNKAGKIYVTVTKSGYSESAKTSVSFKAETSLSLKTSQVKIANNRGKSDVITVSGLAKGDIVKVYNASTKGKLLGKATASSSSTKVSIKQLGKKAGQVYVSVTKSGLYESSRIKASFSKEK